MQKDKEQLLKRILLHETFVDAYARLASAEKSQVKRVLRMLQQQKLPPGLRPHKVESAMSLSPNMDLRIIARPSAGAIELFYVDHHDAAYEWVHRNLPTASEGEKAAMEFAQVGATPASALHAGMGKEYDISEYGGRLAKYLGDRVPAHLIPAIQTIENENDVLEFLPSLENSLQSMVLEAAVSLDEKRDECIAVLGSDEELMRALELPMDKWRIFLHPRQLLAVYCDPPTHMLILGGPGTGKSVLLAHRAVKAAKKLASLQQVALLVTYEDGLVNILQGICS